MGQASTNQPIEELSKVLLGIFSWIILMAVAVIISGKLLAKRVRFGFGTHDRFSINLLILKLRASGDEVSLGFLAFLIALALVSIVGGSASHDYFQSRTGLIVSQWNAICFMASLFSLVAAFVLWVLAPIFLPKPLVSGEERNTQIETIKQQSIDKLSED